MRPQTSPVAAWRFDASGCCARTGQPLARVLELGEVDARALADALRTKAETVELTAWSEPAELAFTSAGGVLLGPPTVSPPERAELERYRSACEGARDGFWLWDLASGTCWMSSEFKTMLGFADDELPNTLVAWLGCLHPDECDEIWHDFRTHVHQDRHYDIEHRLRRKDGSYGWFRFRGRTVFSSAGHPLQAGGSLTDITARKALEARLIDAKDKAQAASEAKSAFLAHMSHELRTPMNGVTGMLDLAMRERLSPRQVEFLSTARRSAEDLLVVLNDILDLSKIESGRLLLESTAFRPWDAVDEVVAVFAPAAVLAGVSVVVEVDPSVPLVVDGDPVRFRQVIKNLVSNAVKFTKSGQIGLHLSYAGGVLHTTVADTGVGIPADRLAAIFEPFVQADASTTRQFGGTGLGLGIARQLAERMGGSLTVDSEPGRGATFHFRAHLPATESPDEARPFEGRRVAVHAPSAERPALCSLLHSLGCEVVPEATPDVDLVVSADARCGPGVRDRCDDRTPVVRVRDPHQPAGFLSCTSSVRRPARRAAMVRVLAEVFQTPLAGEPPECPVVPAVVPLTVPELANTDRRVLVVEDHPVNQVVTRVLLEHLGVACDVVGDGAQAVESVANVDYALVLMDCSMPVMDGFVATERIRGLDLPRQPTIVALTASAMKGDRARCIAAGMDDYLTKPITQPRLAEMLAKQGFLSDTSGADQARLSG